MEKTDKHEACGFAYLVVRCYGQREPVQTYRQGVEGEKKPVAKFLETILEREKELGKSLETPAKNAQLPHLQTRQVFRA